MVEMEKKLVEKPDDECALSFIGYTLAVAGKAPARAESQGRKAGALKPEDGYIMDSLGWILFKTGKADEALQHLEKAADKVKTDPIVAEHLGDILLAKDKKQDALEAYRRSLQVNPENMVIQEKLQKLEQDIQVEKK